MYGFVEARLADELRIEYEPYILNGGSKAAMIDVGVFNKIFTALRKIWLDSGNPNWAKPHILNSDIAGMKVIFHKYYFNDDILNGLTDGRIKDSSEYYHMMDHGIGEQRFNVSDFLGSIRAAMGTPEDTEIPNADRPNSNKYEDEHSLEEYAIGIPRERPERLARHPERDEHDDDEGVPVINDGAICEDRLGDEEPAAEVADNVEESKKSDESDVDRILRIYSEYHSYPNTIISSNEKSSKVFVNRDSFSSNLYETVQQAADSLNRHVIVTDNYKYDEHIKNAIRRKNGSSDVEIFDKYFVIINVAPGNDPTGNFIQIESKAMCFGYESIIFNVTGKELNSKIRDIERAGHAATKQRQLIDQIKKDHSNSPYAKYDAIFKDTVTNVVFAVKNHNYINLLVNLGYDHEYKATKIAFAEIARRYEGKVSVSELLKIDKGYHAAISEQNKDDYVKFAVDSANSVINELKQLLKDATKSNKEYQAKAMESGKMVNKYMAQIHSFNEGDHRKKEEEKANIAYNQVFDLEEVSAIYVKDEMIHVYTHNLYARDGRTNKLHDIGTFHMQIGMNSNKYNPEKTVKITNTKHQITAYNNGIMEAPHVFQNGHICHGNLSTGMTNAYSRRDLFQLVYQLILFLQQANTDDPAGATVNKWPEVDESILNKKEEEKKSEEVVIDDPKDEFDDQLASAIPVNV